MRLLLAACLLAALPAWGCGVCIDDKIASCYDHAVVSAAKANGHAVAFFQIKGDLVASGESRKAILRAIESAPGVRKGSARVSLESAAVSLAYDPKRASLADLRQAIERKLAARRLALEHLRTL